MGAEPSDFRLEAYKSLREEIIHHVQAMSAVVGVALTAIGAIGAFALSKPGDQGGASSSAVRAGRPRLGPDQPWPSDQTTRRVHSYPYLAAASDLLGAVDRREAPRATRLVSDQGR